MAGVVPPGAVVRRGAVAAPVVAVVVVGGEDAVMVVGKGISSIPAVAPEETAIPLSKVRQGPHAENWKFHFVTYQY